MLEVFAHSDLKNLIFFQTKHAKVDLSHQLVLVSVHSRQLSDMREDVLQAIGQLVGVHVVQSEIFSESSFFLNSTNFPKIPPPSPVLHMSVDDQFGESENLPAEMEGVAESGLLSLFRRQRFHRLQVEVVVQMQVVEILSVNQQVEHIVALPQHLQ